MISVRPYRRICNRWVRVASSHLCSKVTTKQLDSDADCCFTGVIFFLFNFNLISNVHFVALVTENQSSHVCVCFIEIPGIMSIYVEREEFDFYILFVCFVMSYSLMFHFWFYYFYFLKCNGKNIFFNYN